MSSRNYALTGETRDGAGKGVARQIRRDKKVPGVIYGDGKAPLRSPCRRKSWALEYHKGHMFTSLCDLEIGGAKHSVLARDIQLHPVTDVVTHIDFLRVTPRTKLHVQIPLRVIGEADAPGLALEKGVLHMATHELDLVCQATDIPDHIDIDLTGKMIGDSIHLNDLTLPPGTKASDADVKKNIMIASLSAPKKVIEEVAAPAEGDAAAAAAPGAATAPAAGAKPEPEKKK